MGLPAVAAARTIDVVTQIKHSKGTKIPQLFHYFEVYGRGKAVRFTRNFVGQI